MKKFIVSLCLIFYSTFAFGWSLADPDVDSLMGWTESGGKVDWFTVGTGLSISGLVMSVNFGTGATQAAYGNHTHTGLMPATHGNTYHSETFVTASAITFASLLANNGVGTLGTQVAYGNHNHSGVYEIADATIYKTATTLGTFTGSTIADNATIKGAIQTLETSFEATVGVRVDTTARTEAPASPQLMWIYWADNTNWDPLSLSGTTAYWCIYTGSSYVGLWDATGNWLFTGVLPAGTSAAGTFGLYSANDPDVTAEGQITWDANGDVVRGHDGTRQVAVARVQEEIHVTVYKPQDLDDAQRDHFWVWSNDSGMSFVVTGWKAWSTSDDTTLLIREEDVDGQNDATIDAVEIATNGTGLYYASDTTITAATIENGHLIYLDFDDTDSPAMVKITILGYYSADVN